VLFHLLIGIQIIISPLQQNVIIVLNHFNIKMDQDSLSIEDTNNN